MSTKRTRIRKPISTAGKQQEVKSEQKPINPFEKSDNSEEGQVRKEEEIESEQQRKAALTERD